MSTATKTRKEPAQERGWPLGNRIVRLTDPEMKPAMDEMRHRIRTDPEYAKSLLRSAGLLTAKGKVPKAYGG